MSIYEVHLGSWRPGRSATADAGRAPRRLRADLGFTHVEFMPVMEHPFGGVVGLPGHRLLRPELALRRPGRLPRLVDRLHQAGIGVILDWVPGALRHRRVGAGPLRRHAALRAPRPAARAGTPTGAPTSSTSAGTRCATSSSPTRSTGSRSSTSTACGSTPSPRCSTSTTPARPASGCPTSTAAARTSRPSSFLQEINAHRLQAGRPASSRSPRSRPRGRASPGRPTRAASASASSGTWAG